MPGAAAGADRLEGGGRQVQRNQPPAEARISPQMRPRRKVRARDAQDGSAQ